MKLPKDIEKRFDKKIGTKLVIDGQTSLYVSEDKAKDILEFELSIRERETLLKLRKWLKGRKICIHDKNKVRNWINEQLKAL